MTKLPEITTKQKEIINLIARFRFLDRIQIQKFLNHKDEARINEWLKDLTEKEYLNRSYKKTFPENTKPAIYHLSKNAIRFLKDQYGDSKIVCKFYRENERSSSFINACLLLACIYLCLQERRSDQVSFTILIKSDYPTHPLGYLLDELKPSAYIKQTTSKESKYYFLELLSPLPLERLRAKLKKYLSFYESNEWEAEARKSFPTLLIICSDETILIYVKRYLKRKLKELDEPTLIIHLSTSQKVRELGLPGDIWQAA